MKIKAKLRQLTDADVRYISLVERGANRIPFRIVKSDSKENSMGIDLSKLGLRVAKSEPAKAAVTAVVLAKNDPALVEKAVESLKEEGFEMKHVTPFDDGSVVLSVDDKFNENSTIIRLNESVAVVMKNFEEQTKVLRSSEIGQRTQAGGFYDGVEGALNFLGNRVVTILKSDGDRSKDLREVVADFYSYVDSLATGVPAAVFKAEYPLTALVVDFEPEVVEKGDKKEDPKEEQAEAADPSKDASGDEAGKKEEAKKEEEAPAAPEEKKEEVKPEEAEKPAEPVQKEEKPVEDGRIDAVLQAVQALTASVGGLTETVQKISGELQDVKKSTEEKLAEVTRKTETAERVLKGTVIGSETPGDPEQESTVVKKQDDDPRTGCFDTAFMPRRY